MIAGGARLCGVARFGVDGARRDLVAGHGVRRRGTSLRQVAAAEPTREDARIERARRVAEVHPAPVSRRGLRATCGSKLSRNRIGGPRLSLFALDEPGALAVAGRMFRTVESGCRDMPSGRLQEAAADARPTTV